MNIIMEELIYWRHPTPPGIKVEEVSGKTEGREALWRELALQVYCENGKESYREIGHYRNGAPFIPGSQSRISITHCPGLLAVASLPPTPETELSTFSERACLGIDAEDADRRQVLRIRERFLSERELSMVNADDVETNVLAWTIKEAAYKAALQEGLDFRADISINRLPLLGPPTPVFIAQDYGLPKDTAKVPDNFYGEVSIRLTDTTLTLAAYSYRSDDKIVTLCYSPKCAKYGKNPKTAL